MSAPDRPDGRSAGLPVAASAPTLAGVPIPKEPCVRVLPDQLRLLVEDRPDELAYRLVRGDGTSAGMSFREWDATASRIAHGLLARGVEPGDRVALAIAPDEVLTYLQCYVAVHKTGGVNVPVNTRMTPVEAVRVLQHAEPTVLVVSPAAAHLAEAVLDVVPTVTSAVSTGDGDARLDPWEKLLSDDDRDVQADIGPDAPADVVYTSGTTGSPKGVLTRHRNGAALEISRPYWNGLHWFHASPMFTSAGQSFIYTPMQLGMSAVTMPKFDTGRFLDLVEAREVHMAFLVPAMIELLLARDDLDRRDLTGLHMVTVGSAPIAPASLQRFNALLPNGSVMNSFALTESGSTAIVMPADEVEAHPGSVGKPLPPTEVTVVDDAGREVPRGETGELLLRNPGKEREYFRDPELTAATWEDGWLRTGDLGRVDEDGFLYVVGRKKDVIIRGGNNVNATDVEAVLHEHPDVSAAAVVGLPHATLGEEVAAFVVGDVDLGQLQDWCRERLTAFKVPTVVERVDELPRNPTGKVLKQELRDRYAPPR